MLRSAAVAVLCASACMACFSPAKADVVYTWETASSFVSEQNFPSEPYTAQTYTPPSFGLSFSVSGPVSFAATSMDAVESFPSNLLAVSFDPPWPGSTQTLNTLFFSSQNPEAAHDGYKWSLSVSADPSNLTGSFSLDYVDEGDQDSVVGTFTTSGQTTISTYSDGFSGQYNYTGNLVAADPPSPTPEPASAWMLLTGIAMIVGMATFRKMSVSPAT